MSMKESVDSGGNQNFIEERGPFKVVSREIKHDRFSMRFNADKVINPDGSEGEQFWIDFPNQAVLIFPFDNEGNIYLSEEFTYEIGKFSIEVAGGVINDGEKPEDAAIRKVKDELGIEAESLGYMGTVYNITSRVNNASHLFLAKVQAVGEANPEWKDTIRLKKVPFEDAYRMALNGQINTDSIKGGIFQIKLFLDSLKKLGS